MPRLPVRGIAAKIALGAMNWVFWIYILNLAFLGANWAIYFRNRRLDAMKTGQCACDRVSVVTQNI